MARFVRQLEDDLRLAEVQPGDAPALFAAVERNRAHLRRWLPWLDANRTPEDTRRWLRECAEVREANGSFQALLWHDGEVAGACGYHRIDWNHRKTALGYWLDQRREGRGWVTRSVVALLDHAFGEMALRRVEIYAATGNARSQAVPGRLGLRREGVLRDAENLYGHYHDLVLFAVTAPEWPGLRAAWEDRRRQQEIEVRK